MPRLIVLVLQHFKCVVTTYTGIFYFLFLFFFLAPGGHGKVGGEYFVFHIILISFPKYRQGIRPL